MNSSWYNRTRRVNFKNKLVESKKKSFDLQHMWLGSSLGTLLQMAQGAKTHRNKKGKFNAVFHCLLIWLHMFIVDVCQKQTFKMQTDKSSNIDMPVGQVRCRTLLLIQNQRRKLDAVHGSNERNSRMHLEIRARCRMKYEESTPSFRPNSGLPKHKVGYCVVNSI